MTSIKETTLYNSIIKGAELEGWLLFKIVDGSVGKKPFDICGLSHDGRAVAIEVKVCRNLKLPDYLPEHLFKKHQLAWLREYAKRGAISLALIYHCGTMTVYDFALQKYMGSLEWRPESKSWHGFRSATRFPLAPG